MPDAAPVGDAEVAVPTVSAPVDSTMASSTTSGSLQESPPGFFAKFFCRRTNRVKDSYATNRSGEGIQQAAPTVPLPANDKYIFDKNSNLYHRQVWVIIVSVAFTYNLLFIISRVAFAELYSGNAWIPWLIFDVLADIIYILDMIVQSRTGFLEQGLLVRDSKRIRTLYIKSWDFAVDVISLLPFDYVMLAVSRPFPFGRIVRLLRVGRTSETLDRIEMRISYPNFFRVCCLISYILLLIHWNACIYFIVSDFIGLGSDTWVYGVQNKQSLPAQYNDNLLRRYVYSVYWSTLTLTTIGEVPPPVRDIEFVFVTIDSMVGFLICATIVGNTGSLIVNMREVKRAFENRMDRIKEYMQSRNVNKTIQRKVIGWFGYLWSHQQPFNDTQVFEMLPEKLQAEIAMHAHFETLRKVRIFQDCETGLLQELVLKLTLHIYCPGDFICKKDEIGVEMFIVKKGTAQVVSSVENDTTVFATLQEGAVFGELSVLNIPGALNGSRRTASIRSLGYTHVFVLHKDDLWKALKEYPAARKSLMEKGREILRKDNLLDERFTGQDMPPEELLDSLVQLAQRLETHYDRLVEEKREMEANLHTRIEFLGKELEKRRIRHAKAEFTRHNTLTVDFEPLDPEDRPGTSYNAPIHPNTKKTN